MNIRSMNIRLLPYSKSSNLLHLAALACFCIPSSLLAQGYVIATVAGGNPFISSIGNGDLATNAYLNSPAGVAVDAAGNIYIADTGNHAVRKVSANGVISAFAGTGTPGFAGDGGPAVSAQLRGPTGLALDKNGNLYICDTSNNRIRKVSTTGVITTVAGNATLLSSGVGDGGLATSANLNLPRGVLPDASGNFYIADTANHRVRKVDSNGTITTVAGNGTASNGGSGSFGDGGSALVALVGPAALAFDNSGNLYIADSLNHLIRKVSNGTITSVAGIGVNGYYGDSGLAIKAALNQPQGIVVDATGNIFVADSGNMVIRKIGTDGNINTIAGTGDYGSYGDGGPAGAATLSDPTGLALANNGRIYVAGSSSTGFKDARIRVLIPVGTGSAPTISTNGVVPVFGSTTTIMPGSWISIYGTNLASTTAVWNGDFPNALGNTAVTIDGKPAFLWYVSPNQINAQAPDDSYIGAVYVAVTTPSGSALSVVTLSGTAPSLSMLNAKYPAAVVFTPGKPGNSGNGYDIIGPAGAFPYTTRPAVAGETVVLYGVGFGPTVPAVPAGQPFSGSAELSAYPVVTIGTATANVNYAGMVQAGLYQINLVVPSGVKGDQSLAVSVNGSNAQTGIFLTVQ